MGQDNDDYAALSDWARFQKDVPVSPMQSMKRWGSDNGTYQDMQQFQANQGIRDFLQRLQFSAYLQDIQGKNMSGVAGDGRVGYRFPLGQDELALGVSGRGERMKFDTPGGPMIDRAFRLNGVDATYQRENDSFGVDYKKDPQRGNIWNFNYKRQF